MCVGGGGGGGSEAIGTYNFGRINTIYTIKLQI